MTSLHPPPPHLLQGMFSGDSRKGETGSPYGKMTGIQTASRTEQASKIPRERNHSPPKNRNDKCLVLLTRYEFEINVVDTNLDRLPC